jgi:hypothetical protein
MFKILTHSNQPPQSCESQREFRPQQVTPVCSSEHDDPLERPESLAWEPPPLKIGALPAPIKRRTFRPHFGQALKGLSDML